MIKKLLAVSILISGLQSCSENKTCENEKCMEDSSNLYSNSSTIKAQNSSQEVSCKLTTEELRKRKETVLQSLKKQILEKKELEDGFAFKFSGNDSTADELIEFVKSERSCCNFFVFTLSFSGDGSEAWLSLTGPDGTKEMISDELGL